MYYEKNKSTSICKILFYHYLYTICLFSFCVGYTTKRVVYNERSTSDIYVIDNYFYEKLKDDSNKGLLSEAQITFSYD